MLIVLPFIQSLGLFIHFTAAPYVNIRKANAAVMFSCQQTPKRAQRGFCKHSVTVEHGGWCAQSGADR